jgi:hypothetical protein
MKRCFKCGAEKPLTQFYTHPGMADGHLNKCKDCAKVDVRTDRAVNPRARAYDRERSKLPHRRANVARVSKAWDVRHPERAKAQTAAGNAVRDGRLQKPTLCEGCGLPRRLDKHHHDYSKPLVVVWLCKPCHSIADKIRRRLEAA